MSNGFFDGDDDEEPKLDSDRYLDMEPEEDECDPEYGYEKRSIHDCFQLNFVLKQVIRNYFPSADILIMNGVSNKKPYKIMTITIDNIPAVMLSTNRMEEGYYSASFCDKLSPAAAAILAMAIHISNFNASPTDNFTYEFSKEGETVFSFNEKAFFLPEKEVKESDENADKKEGDDGDSESGSGSTMKYLN